MDELRRKRQEKEARKFMESLRDCPFIAVVMTPDGPMVYRKSSDDKLRQDAIELLSEVSNA